MGVQMGVRTEADRDYIYIQHLYTDKNRDIFLAQHEPSD